MIDPDDAFERFARRFRAIERQVPASPPATFAGQGHGPSTVHWSLLGSIVAGLVLIAALTIGPNLGLESRSASAIASPSHPGPSAIPTLAVSQAASAPSQSSSPSPSGPATSCDPEPTGYTIDGLGSEVPLQVRLTCAAAVQAALDRIGGSSNVISADFHYGSYCPPGAWCAFTNIDRGYVVLRNRAGQDSMVAVAIDAHGNIVASAPGMFPPEPNPPASVRVEGYVQALVDGNDLAAWTSLAPGFRSVALDSNYQRYADERTAFFRSVGGRFAVTLRSQDPSVLGHWALPRLTAGANLSTGSLVEVHYPALAAQYPTADPTCSSDFYLVAKDSSGTTWIWWVGDTSAVANGSCSRSPADYSSAGG